MIQNTKTTMYEALVIWILFTTCIHESAYSLIAPFLPLEFERKHIPAFYTGMVFSMFSVAVIIFAPLVGRIFDRVGHKNLLSGGIGFMGIAIVCFGFIENMSNRVNIIVLAFILRFVQGLSNATLLTSYFTIATNDYKEKKVEIIGWIEAMIGLGLVIGPIIGSTLYSAFGFKGTFFVYGGFKIVLAIVMRVKLPDRRSQDGGAEAQVSDEQLSDQSYQSLNHEEDQEGKEEQGMPL